MTKTKREPQFAPRVSTFLLAVQLVWSALSLLCWVAGRWLQILTPGCLPTAVGLGVTTAQVAVTFANENMIFLKVNLSLCLISRALCHGDIRGLKSTRTLANEEIHK